MRLDVPALAAASLLAAALLASACSTTTALRPKATQQASGFLGDAYAKLQPGAEGQAALRYVNEDVNWRQYSSILVDPVQFWAGSDSTLPVDVQQMLSTYLYNSLKLNLEKQGFTLADLPAPGVIRAQFAICDVTKATPVLRTVSLAVPQARLLNQAQQLLTGSYAFAGSVEVALKATDARTGELLAAAIDRRGGGGGLQQATVWQWGDAEAAIDVWTQRATQRLAELRARSGEQ
jgi:hypothetical protein